MTEHNSPLLNGYDEELYLEPPRMNRRDTVEVCVALLALVIIGISGYIWLNPELSMAGLAVKREQGIRSEATVVASADSTDTPDGAEARVSCPYCGMFADISHAQVVAEVNGEHSHFDSWDCVFMYQSDNKLKYENPAVMRHGGTPEDADWLIAEDAWFLYDTIEIEGSMPPYVAAFESKEAAEAAQGELGGELVDFAGLRSKWQ